MPRSMRYLFLLALAPFVLATARGRRLHPRLPAAAALAALVGAVVGGVALVVILAIAEEGPGPPNFGLMGTFVFLVLPWLMTIVETLTARMVIGRVGAGFFVSLMAHIVWTVLLIPLLFYGGAIAAFDVIAALGAVAIVVLPGALLGGAGAAVGAALESKSP
jgi:hypothetical protein